MRQVEKKSDLRLLNLFMFTLVFIVRIIIDVFNEKGILLSGMDNIKYLVISVAIFFGFFEIILNKMKNGKVKYIFFKELILACIVCSTFLVYSVFLARRSGLNINSRTYVEIIYLIMPVLYSFSIINTCSFKEIEKMMHILFWIYLIIYIYSIDIFSITFKDILSISFSESTSCFESSVFAFPMLVLFFFFSYYRKNNKYYWIASFLLTLLTFKRMILVWAIILFTLDNISEIRFNIRKGWKYIFALLFIVATIWYFGALTDTGIGNIIFDNLGIDLESETMGRKWFLRLLIDSNYSSFGYGSSSVALGQIFNLDDIKYLEMDLIKTYLELGIGGLSVICIYFWKITKNNLFNIIMMLSIFMNLLVSHSLSDPFDWTIIYLILICVSENLSKRNDMSGKTKYIIKFK